MPKPSDKRRGRKTKSPDFEQGVVELQRTEKWIESLPEKQGISVDTHVWWSSFFHHWRGFIDSLMRFGLTNDAVATQVRISFYDEADPPFVVSVVEARTYLKVFMKEQIDKNEKWRWRPHYEILLKVLGG